jgi:hypothetical protein
MHQILTIQNGEALSFFLWTKPSPAFFLLSFVPFPPLDACLWRREAHLAETDGFAFLELDEIKGMERQDAIELEALMGVTDRMFAGEQKAKIARAPGPDAPGFDTFDRRQLNVIFFASVLATSRISTFSTSLIGPSQRTRTNLLVHSTRGRTKAAPRRSGGFARRCVGPFDVRLANNDPRAVEPEII